MPGTECNGVKRNGSAMRYWLDTEFIADGTNLDLLSIGIVADDGREFYAENADADFSRANDWVRENVLPRLIGDGYDFARDALVSQIRQYVQWTGEGEPPEFWGWCCGLDYAAVSLLFGLDDWPRDWPFYFNDIQQAADRRGVALAERDQDGQPDPHNALMDARRIKELWERLAGDANGHETEND